jgi:hypothetical protein
MEDRTMQFVAATMIHHATESDGTERKNHCCGCWHIILDEGALWPVYARCNECGEHREIGRGDLGA